MPSKLTFLTGRAGAGKSALLRGMIKNTLENEQGKRVFLIVPEQFTFETEKELAEDFGAGLLGVGVYSFTTLSEYITEQSGIRKVFLSPQGRRMLIRRAIRRNAHELAAFSTVASKQGFTEKCDELFELCSRFLITPQVLSAAADTLDGGTLLSRKLHDLALLYSDCDEAMKSRGVSSNDIYNAVMDAMPSSPLKDAAVFIDGFDLMTEQIYGMISKMMQVCSAITVSVRTDISSACRDRQVFFAENRALERIRDSARENGCTVKTITLPSSNAHFATAALKHLEHEAFASKFTPSNCDTDGICVFAASSRLAEAQAVADAILLKAKEGMRFRDMAIIASDMTVYSLPVLSALSARNIPFFTDAKHPLSSYGAARFLLYSLRAITSSFSSANVLELLKCGMLSVERSDAEKFENYVLRFGIKKFMFTKPFDRGDFETPERVRDFVVTPLLKLRDSLFSGQTVALKTEALYAYAQECGIFDKQMQLSTALMENNFKELADENSQIAEMLVTLLSQLHEIMGDDNASTPEFAAMFEEGLSGYEIGSIPATVDQVLFGSVGRTRARSLKAIFILGATEGNFPHSTADDSIIDDKELKLLSNSGITPWYSNREKTLVAYADVYSAITKPKEFLHISYPISSGTQAPIPCSLIERIFAIFPKLELSSDVAALQRDADSVFSPSPEGAFSSLIKRLRRLADTSQLDTVTEFLYSQFYNAPEYRSRLEQAEEALYTQNSPEPFGRELALELYGHSPHGSASRLETFNACPFKHFARYGLKILPRREYKEQKLDEGTFCHDALDGYINAIIALDVPLSEITDEQSTAILASVLPELLRTHNNGILLSSARYKAVAKRLCVTVKETASAILKQLQNGSFTPLGCELSFGDGEDAVFPAITLDIGGGKEYKISGRIDRVDKAKGSDCDVFRVIDYKGSSRSFSFHDLYHGLALQLPLYISAVVAANDAARIAGVYYQIYSNPVLDDAEAKENFKEKLAEQFKLRGITLDDEEILTLSGMDKKTKNRLTLNQMSLVTDYALSKAQSTAVKIFDGDASIAPYRKGTSKSACDYCDYSSVCRFDVQFKDCRYKSISSLNKDAFFEALKGDDGDEVDS